MATAQMVLHRPAFGGFGGGRSFLPARRAGPSPALTKATAAVDGLKLQLRRARENVSGKGGKVQTVVLTIVGGAVGGAVKAKFPSIPGIDLDSRIPLAAVAIGAGLFLVKGSFGAILIDVGAGIAATISGDMAEEMLSGAEGAEGGE